MMLRRLRLKFVCINMLIVSVMLSLILILVFSITRISFERESIQMMRAIAMTPVQPEDPADHTEQIRLPYFVVEPGEGNRLICADSGYYNLTSQEFLDEVTALAVSSGAQSGILPAYSLRFCRVETPNGERIVFADISSELSAVSQLVQTCLLTGTAGFFIFFLVSLFLARWAVKPVAKAWTQQRRFVADASHELKTPLTVILATAELLQSPEYDEAARLRFSGNILATARRMRGLVEDLLELARVESGRKKAPLERVDLSQLLENALLPFEPLYFEQGLSIVSRIDSGITVKGDAAELRQTADILLDNARKYSSPGGTVSVTLTRQGRRHCLLSVANPGETISREELSSIFQRFYRGEKIRSVSCGYGLGLPIAKSIVTAHRGRIWAESAGGINTFFVQFPLLRPRTPQKRGLLHS